MKNRVNIIILFVLLFSLNPNNAFSELSSSNDVFSSTNDKIIQMYPKYLELGKSNPNNIDIQLGLLFLYTEYGDPNTFLRRKPPLEEILKEYGGPDENIEEAQFEKILKLDPKNKIARAAFVRSQCRHYINIRAAELSHWQIFIDKAKKNNGRVELWPSGYGGGWVNPFYDFFDFKEDWVKKGMPVNLIDYVKHVKIIEDINAATEIVYKHANQDLPKVFELIDKAQPYDKANALYDYLRAYAYFTINDEEKAIKELKKAASKKILRIYIAERSKCVRLVLQKINFPKRELDYVVNKRFLFVENFMRSSILNKGFGDVIKRYEDKKDFKQAEEMYKILIQMHRHCLQEEISNPFGLEKYATEKIKELKEKEAKEKQGG